MSSSAVLRGAIRTRDHDHPPAEKLTHPHTRRIPLHREVEHRSAKQLVSTAPVLWVWVSRAGRGAGREKPGRAPPRERGNFSRCTRSQETVPSHLYTGTMFTSRASRAHIWHVGGVAVLGCRARYKSHITRHINNIALWRHNPHINA